MNKRYDSPSVAKGKQLDVPDSQMGFDFLAKAPVESEPVPASEAQDAVIKEQADPAPVPSSEGVRSEPVPEEMVVSEAEGAPVTEQADPAPVDSEESVRSEPPSPTTMDPTVGMSLFESTPDPTILSRSLIDEYKIPPFSVFDTRQGYWQDRKRIWISLGIQSEIGREEKLTYGKFNQDYDAKTRAEWESMTDEERAANGHKFTNTRALNPHTRQRYGGGSTSVFDPVLTEIMYRWLCPPGGAILDPFAGGSVRGIVAACLGHPYVGIELRGVQVDANREQAKEILRPDATGPEGKPIPPPLWVKGDSAEILEKDPTIPYDFIFTCPPYADLEIYSDDPADLSNMKPQDFDTAYRHIMETAARSLADDRFAAIVVSNIRDKAGNIRDLCGLTCRAMAAGGAQRYNDAVIINVAGTAALRARKQFNTSRKLVAVHQTILVFCKGDPRAASAIIPSAASQD